MSEEKITKLDPIYLTSAIAYTNGPGHIGHAYEIISVDILARYHRLYGRPVYFLTGTDEHGQKIEKTAELLNLKPKELCDKNSELFKELYSKLLITNDYFIRTTDEEHKLMAQKIFQRVYDKGDIYLGNYTGWYNTREERFITEIEALSTNYIDPLSGKEYQKVNEQSYFFKLEKYRQDLIKYITPNFIPDETYRNEILKRLEEPLQDLSISRSSFNWGIPIPELSLIEKTDKKHVMYVWFDALTNYLSGKCKKEDKKENKWGYYNSPIHIIGQDILWFHAVIWPCMLISSEIPLPKSIIVHGFINDLFGRKMSKSLGNVIDPDYLLKQYTIDSIRYYFIRAGIYGSDIKFSEEKLKLKNNTELADNYGNLINRIFSLTEKYCNSIIPEDLSLYQTIDLSIIEKIDILMNKGQLSLSLDIIIHEVHLINQWIQEKAPWKYDTNRKNIIKCSLEKIYIITHLLSPFIPVSTNIVFKKYNHGIIELHKLKNNNLKSNHKIDTTKIILFEKLKI